MRPFAIVALDIEAQDAENLQNEVKSELAELDPETFSYNQFTAQIILIRLRTNAELILTIDQTERELARFAAQYRGTMIFYNFHSVKGVANLCQKFAGENQQYHIIYVGRHKFLGQLENFSNLEFVDANNRALIARDIAHSILNRIVAEAITREEERDRVLGTPPD